MKKLVLFILLVAAGLGFVMRAPKSLPAPAARPVAVATTPPAAPPAPVGPRACLETTRFYEGGALQMSTRSCLRANGVEMQKFARDCAAVTDTTPTADGRHMERSPLDDCPAGELGSCDVVAEKFFWFFYEPEGPRHEEMKMYERESPTELAKVSCSHLSKDNVWHEPR